MAYPQCSSYRTPTETPQTAPHMRIHRPPMNPLAFSKERYFTSRCAHLPLCAQHKVPGIRTAKAQQNNSCTA